MIGHLQHDDGEEDAAEHGAQLGGAQQPRPREDEVVARDQHQRHLHDLKKVS